MTERLVRLEFLLEEPSMENFLKIILPQILPEEYQLGINYFLRPHQGKDDLKRSIPKKLQAFSHPSNEAKIIILHDQDNHDCKKLKQELSELCSTYGTCATLIRIVCRELECWYLGDLEAIQKAYPKFKANYYKSKEKFRNSDECCASRELKRILPNFQKGQASKLIPIHMQIENNNSVSFKYFVKGLQKLIK